MNAQIIFATLKARPVRTAVGILAVTLEVVLILLLVGLTNGTIKETGDRVAGVGAELLLKEENSGYFIGMNSAILPIKELGGDIAKVPGVKAVAPIVTQTDTSTSFTVIYGIDLASFDAVSGGFTFLEGGPFTGPDTAIVDDWQATSKHIKVGDSISIVKRSFTVTGIVQNGKGSRVFIPIETAQKMVGHEGLATAFYIKLENKDDTKDAIVRIREALSPEMYDIGDVNEFVTMMFSSNASRLNIVFEIVEFLGVIIGVLVIFLSMYTAVTERTREIGILRSMGASKTYIIVLILEESLVLCVAGAAVGIGLSFVVAALLKKMFPTLVILISGDWILRAALFALLSGVIGSLYPSYKAAAHDPIEALAYE